jgi:glycosyltransferase involved in cell wall biosynthesis
MTKVAFTVTNCICFDQRVLKMAECLRRLNCVITIAGRKLGDCCNSGSVPYKTKRFRMLFKKGFLFYSSINMRLFFYLLFHKFDLIVANDLDTLLPGLIVSKLKKVNLVYDSHEYFTGLPEIQNRRLVKYIWTTIERIAFPHLKNVITVSEPIALLYEKTYGLRPVVIRNLSKNTDDISPFQRSDLGVALNDILLVMQGTGINVDKGAEELIYAISQTEGISLLVIGRGDVLSGIKNKVVELKITEKVKFIPAVTWETLMKYTKTADIGMCLEKDTNLSYRYSLPNKLFDYIAAGIPVIASDLPETRKIINDNNCGIIIDMVTPSDIREALNEIKMNPHKLAEYKINSVIAARSLNWETESKKVEAFYRKIILL